MSEFSLTRGSAKDRPMRDVAVLTIRRPFLRCKLVIYMPE